MKLLFGLLALYWSAISGMAQALAPSGPALPQGRAPVLSPGSPATAPRPVMPPLAPPPRPGMTTVTTANPGALHAVEPDLQNVLLNMQAVLAETIPALAAYNDSLGFVVTTNTFTSTNTDLSRPPVPHIAGRSGQNFSSAHGANASSRAGANLSGNASSVIGVSPAITMPSVPAGASATPPTITDTSVPAQSPNTVSASSTVTPRETLRALLLLQHDLDRALALVNAVNTSPDVPDVNLTPTGR